MDTTANYIISIYHDCGENASNLAEFIACKLEEIGYRTNPNATNDRENLDLIKLKLLLISKEFNEWAATNQDTVREITENDRPVLPIVIDNHSRNPLNWAVNLSRDRFYIDMVPNDDGRPAFEKVKELQDKTRILTGIRRQKYYITMHGSPNWRSFVQKDSPYLQNGFTDKSGGCGGGGIFEAFDEAVPGMKEIVLGKETLWVSTEKTHLNMLEWRVFTVQNRSKFLITSNRSDTAPGWSIQELFYAPGTPTIGCDQLTLLSAHAKNKVRYHIFNSHNWSNGNHARVMQAHRDLSAKGIISWIDEEQLNETDCISDQLYKGINSTAIVVVYITKAYVDKVNGDNMTDNCLLEFMHCKSRYSEGAVKLVFAISEVDSPEYLSHPVNWGIIGEQDCNDIPIVSLRDGSDKLTNVIYDMLGLKPALFYITMQEWKSYVNKGSYFERNGFKRIGSCGANGVFEAYEEPALGLVKIEVEGATFYASKEKVSLLQLEWRCYNHGGPNGKYLITSNRRDMAPGWTFLSPFYARGRPSNGCDQKATI